MVFGIWWFGFGLYGYWTTHPSGGLHLDKESIIYLLMSIGGGGILGHLYENSQNYFITKTRWLDVKIGEIFDDAKRYIIIVSPYFNAGENRLRDILDSRKRGVHITVIVHSRTLVNIKSVQELSTLQDNGCLIKVHPDMHSKIYMNERGVLTGSVNLVEGSFKRSLEFGSYTENVNYHKEVVNLIKYVYLNEDSIEDFNRDKIKTGFCIRTKNIINYDIRHPIERNEFLSNYDKSGKYCHKCGKKSGTNVSEPLCEDCIDKS